jgi:hypothetical protein
MRSRIPGEPTNEDLQQQKESDILMKMLPTHSPAYPFYKSLYKQAKENIERDTHDEDDFDMLES